MNGIFFAYQTGKSGLEVAFLLPQIIGFQDNTNYVAIGGVTPENIPEFRKAGCLGVGLASSLMPKDKAAARDWDACAEYVHMLLTFSSVFIIVSPFPSDMLWGKSIRKTKRPCPLRSVRDKGV